MPTSSLSKGMVDGLSYQWVMNGVHANCDRCNAKVWPNQPRLRLHDHQGKSRGGSKGSDSSWLCSGCARKLHRLLPPPEKETRDPMDQIGMMYE